MSNDNVTDIFGSVDTGGFSDIDVQMTNCRFGNDPGYTDSTTGDMLDVFIYDQLGEEGQVRENQILSIGKGLKIVDGGARVDWVNPKHTKGGFARGSKMQVLLESALALDADALAARHEATGLIPRDAGFWEGFTFHLMEEESSFTRNGVEQKYRKTVASEVYGWDGFPDAAPEPAPAPKSKPKAPAKPKAKPTPPARPSAPLPTGGDEAGGSEAGDGGLSNVYGIRDEVFAQLVGLATAADDHYAFMEEAYKLDELFEDGVQGVVDDADGLFAAVKAA